MAKQLKKRVYTTQNVVLIVLIVASVVGIGSYTVAKSFAAKAIQDNVEPLPGTVEKVRKFRN